MSAEPCVTCRRVLPLEDFAVRRVSRDGRQARCRTCFAEWYAANADLARLAIERRKARVRQEHQERLVELLDAHPCVDCGEEDLRVLDFDHRPGEDKQADVATLLRKASPWARIEAEIAKCAVRCANCHRRRTCERAGWWKQVVWEQRPSSEQRLLEVLGQ